MCRKFGLALSPVNSFFGEPPPSWDRVKTPNFGTYLVPGYYLVLFVYSLAYWMLVPMCFDTMACRIYILDALCIVWRQGDSRVSYHESSATVMSSYHGS